jgi:4-hydroxy-tetrahydrodipicolinate synthase
VTQSLGTVLTAMVTPFDDGLAVDYEALIRLAGHLLDNGSDGLVVAGTTGESPTLTDDEKTEMFRAVVAAAHDKGTIVAGTGSNDTGHSIALSRRAASAGVDAMLVVTPYYNKPPERGLLAHFEAIASAVDLPMIIYNIPSRCGVNLSPAALAQLSRIDSIVAVKQANPDLAESRRLRETCDLGLYAGNDDMFLDVLKLGGWGGICVASHLVGARLQAIAKAFRAGDVSTAERLDAELAPLYKTLFVTTNPIPVKCALDLVGLPAGGLRLPLVPAAPDEREQIAAELRRQNLI